MHESYIRMYLCKHNRIKFRMQYFAALPRNSDKFRCDILLWCQDDGNKFINDGYGGQPYASSFGQDDVIGVGVRPLSNTIFFTKNGIELGTASQGGTPQVYFPSVGSDDVCSLQWNFGDDASRPFCYEKARGCGPGGGMTGVKMTWLTCEWQVLGSISTERRCSCLCVLMYNKIQTQILKQRVLMKKHFENQ